MRLVYPLAVLVLASACTTPPSAQTVELVDPFPSLTFSTPVELLDAGDGTDYLYVAEQAGRIKVFENSAGTTSAPVFLDIRDRVVDGGEMGLLGLAFDPDFAANGFFYVNYTVTGPRRQRVSRFTRTAASPPQADAATEEILYEGDPALACCTNHNAGALAFGPPEGPGGERYLYVTHGDGGSGGDPDDNGQDLSTLLGKIVRLDVDGGGGPLDCAEAGSATVPPDNPFAGQPGACGEIYAYGFRNPWRMRFDEGGDWALWVGDVGQSQWEEVDLVEAGGNYGWNEYEGNHCFESPCDPAGKTFPVYEYNHAGGRLSITGGYVYRGSAIPELVGEYVYADLSGPVYALDLSGGTPANEQITSAAGLGGCSGYCLSSFGEDAEGELYVLGSNGPIRRLVRNPPAGTEGPPAETAALAVTGPNPARGRTALRFAAGPPGSPARLTLHDALGRLVAVLYDGPAQAPSSEVVVDTATLAPGVYVARLSAGGSTESVSLTALR